MATPQRIQLSRRAGSRKPEGAVVVSRPSRWGNPFKVVRIDCTHGGMCWTVTDGNLTYDHIDRPEAAAQLAVDMFELHTGPMGNHEYDDATLSRLHRDLAGRDLCCWCPLDQPCHADVLLRLAAGES